MKNFSRTVADATVEDTVQARISYPEWPRKRSCSIGREAIIRRCEYKRYKELAEFHYRAGNAPAVISDVFGAFFRQRVKGPSRDERLVGIIVYARPA